MTAADKDARLVNLERAFQEALVNYHKAGRVMCTARDELERATAELRAERQGSGG